MKKPKNGRLTEAQQTYNYAIRGIHGVCERANSRLRQPSRPCAESALDPSRITEIAAAALVLLQLEYGRTI